MVETNLLVYALDWRLDDRLEGLIYPISTTRRLALCRKLRALAVGEMRID